MIFPFRVFELRYSRSTKLIKLIQTMPTVATVPLPCGIIEARVRRNVQNETTISIKSQNKKRFEQLQVHYKIWHDSPTVRLIRSRHRWCDGDRWIACSLTLLCSVRCGHWIARALCAIVKSTSMPACPPPIHLWPMEEGASYFVHKHIYSFLRLFIISLFAFSIHATDLCCVCMNHAINGTYELN